MATLPQKIQHALSESLMLTTGTQLLVGFHFRAVFDTGFARLRPMTQLLHLTTLALLLAALALLLTPAAYHRIVEAERDTPQFHRFVKRTIELALLPLAVGLGIDVAVASGRVLGSVGSLLAGGSTTLLALFWWYGVELLHHAPHVAQEHDAMDGAQKPNAAPGTSLDTKVDNVLIEARVVLPGAQAVLGFQLAITLTERFDQLSTLAKDVHLTSMVLIALSTILLIAPAAYHRIVAQGEDTDDFLRFASRMVLAAMACLGLGASGDFFVVVQKVQGRTDLALGMSGLLLVICYGLWFGYTFYRRRQHSEATTGLR